MQGYNKNLQLTPNESWRETQLKIVHCAYILFLSNKNDQPISHLPSVPPAKTFLDPSILDLQLHLLLLGPSHVIHIRDYSATTSKRSFAPHLWIWCGPTTLICNTKTGSWSTSWWPGDPSWKTGPLLTAQKSCRSNGNSYCYSIRTKSLLKMVGLHGLNTTPWGTQDFWKHQAPFYTTRASQHTMTRTISSEQLPPIGSWS